GPGSQPPVRWGGSVRRRRTSPITPVHCSACSARARSAPRPARPTTVLLVVAWAGLRCSPAVDRSRGERTAREGAAHHGRGRPARFSGRAGLGCYTLWGGDRL